jgi:hypothetical protein
MVWKSLLAATVAFLSGSAVALYAAGPPLGSGPVEPLAVNARAVPFSRADPGAERVGRLRFLGAIDLTSPDQRFGGLSDMLWEPACGRLLAVTDTGAWVVLEPKEEGERLTAIGQAWIAPLLGSDGAPRRSKYESDAEGLARTASGDLWVFFEQVHHGERFRGVSACRPESLAAAPDDRWEPAEAANWPGNGGAEAVAARGERLLILSESMPGPAARRMGLEGVPGGPVDIFSYAAPPEFEPTAMVPLGDGTRLLILHRRFSPLTGAAALLAEAEAATPVQTVLEPREIARLAPPLAVDNMEALAVRTEGGRTFIYLASDNNFNPLQKTILMKFELLPGEP